MPARARWEGRRGGAARLFGWQCFETGWVAVQEMRPIDGAMASRGGTSPAQVRVEQEATTDIRKGVREMERLTTKLMEDFAALISARRDRKPRRGGRQLRRAWRTATRPPIGREKRRGGRGLTPWRRTKRKMGLRRPRQGVHRRRRSLARRWLGAALWDW